MTRMNLLANFPPHDNKSEHSPHRFSIEPTAESNGAISSPQAIKRQQDPVPLNNFDDYELVQETNNLPLVVDLDGTLTLTDTLTESVIQLVKRNPSNIIRLPIWLLQGRSAFKHKIAARSNFSAE